MDTNMRLAQENYNQSMSQTKIHIKRKKVQQLEKQKLTIVRKRVKKLLLKLRKKQCTTINQ